MKYEVHVHSRALNVLFDQFPTPTPDCYARIAKAWLLSQGETTPNNFDPHFTTMERFKPDPDLFIFPDPICVLGNEGEREATKHIAIARCLRIQGILSVAQADLLERKTLRDTGAFGATVPFVHFVQVSSWDKLKFLTWAQPKYATVDDFVCLVFKVDEDKKKNKKAKEKETAYLHQSPLVCIHHLKTR